MITPHVATSAQSSERDRKLLADSTQVPELQTDYPMASSSQPAFLPPSVGGPSDRLKEYTKLLVESAQTSLITKFDRYMEQHPLQPGQDKRARITTFITSVDDAQERKKALNFLLEHYEDADYTRRQMAPMCIL